MAKICPVTGKKYNKAFSVSFSHKRNIKKQNVNFQSKRVWDPEKKVWVRLNLSTAAIKLISKYGSTKVLAIAKKHNNR